MNLQRLALLTLTLCLPVTASAGEKSGATKAAGPEDLLREALSKSRPKGWRLIPGRGAPGITVMLHGPRRAEGTPVVTARRWSADRPRPETPADVAALAKALGLEPGFTRSALDGPLGPVLDAPPRSGLQVRFVLHRSALLTIAAPPRLLPSASAWVLEALRRLPAAE